MQIENLIPFFLGHQLTFFNDELMQGLTSVVTFVGDFRAGLVTEVRLQDRDNAQGTHHQVLAAFDIGGDTVNALRTHAVHGVGHDLHTEEQSPRDRGFHHVQFELASRGSQHDRGVQTSIRVGQQKQPT